jgi:hypothetical protein
MLSVLIMPRNLLPAEVLLSDPTLPLLAIACYGSQRAKDGWNIMLAGHSLAGLLH